MTDKQVIFQKLLNLQQEDLKEVKDRIDYLLTQNSTKKGITDVELFYKELIYNIQKITAIKYPESIFIVKKQNTKMYKNVMTAFNFITVYLETILEKEKITVLVKQKLYSLYSELLIGYFQEMGVLLCLKTCVQNYDKFPALIEQNFPGYINSKHGGMIFQ